MRTTTWRATAVAVAVAALVTGCATIDQLSTGEEVLAARGDDDETPSAIALEIDEVEDRFEGEGVGGDDEVILAALQDVEAYWDTEFEELFGDDFEPVEAFYAYGPDTEQPPCGVPPPTYEEIAANAFFCPGSDLIAWDTTQLIPDMQDVFGDFALGIVMAHEYGHAIQDRAALDSDLTITFEQQADCYAGAWAQWVREADPGALNFELALDDLDTSLAGFLELRDTLGTSLADPAAHGTAFDRVSAFQDGFFNGADACAEYSDENFPAVPLEVFDEEFLTREEDAPFGQVEAFTVDDLNNFWTVVFDQLGAQWEPPDTAAVEPTGDVPECGGEPIDDDAIEGEALYCAEDDLVAWDEANLMPELYDEIGDFSMATVIGSQFSLAALEKLGDEADDLDRALRADCLTGAWIASAVISDRGIADEQDNPLGNEFILTPGDLDEVVQAYLTRGDLFTELDSELGDAGTAFVRIAALRRGITTGIGESNSMVAVADCLEEFRTGD
jgi:predicted metalloprotease